MPQRPAWVTMEIGDPETKNPWDSGLLLLLNTGYASELPVAVPHPGMLKKFISLALFLLAGIALVVSIIHNIMPLGMVALVTALLCGRELLSGTEQRAHNGLKQPAAKEWLASNRGKIIVLSTGEVCPMGDGSINIWGREGREAELAVRLQRLLPALPDTEEATDLLDAAVSNIALKAELTPLTKLGAAANKSPSKEHSIRATAAAHRALKAEHRNVMSTVEELMLRLEILAKKSRKGLADASS